MPVIEQPPFDQLQMLRVDAKAVVAIYRTAWHENTGGARRDMHIVSVIRSPNSFHRFPPSSPRPQPSGKIRGSRNSRIWCLNSFKKQCQDFQKTH